MSLLKKGISMKEVNKKEFENGIVYALKTEDSYLVEVTDTFLPFYTKDAVGKKQNNLHSRDLGSRDDRWMIGVSCMSGCPVGCKFCATGNIRKWRNLTRNEIVNQVEFVLQKNKDLNFGKSKEHKINYTRMGEPFMNINNVREAILEINSFYPETHHYVSTIGLKGSDFSWIEGNVTLQISLHAMNDDRRRELIPINSLMSIRELGQIRTKSDLKTTINLTLVKESDFDIKELKKYFDPEHFFIKLSPINVNSVSEKNKLGNGAIDSINII